MATIRLPDGKTLQIPDGATAEQAQTYYDQAVGQSKQPAPAGTPAKPGYDWGAFGQGFKGATSMEPMVAKVAQEGPLAALKDFVGGAWDTVRGSLLTPYGVAQAKEREARAAAMKPEQRHGEGVGNFFNLGTTLAGMGPGGIAVEAARDAAVKAAASTPVAVTGAALKGAAKGAAAPVRAGHLRLPVPASLAGAGAGGAAAHYAGLPTGVGATIGAVAPAVKGSMDEVRSVLASRRAAAAKAAAPAPVPEAPIAPPPAPAEPFPSGWSGTAVVPSEVPKARPTPRATPAPGPTRAATKAAAAPPETPAETPAAPPAEPTAAPAVVEESKVAPQETQHIQAVTGVRKAMGDTINGSQKLNTPQWRDAVRARLGESAQQIAEAASAARTIDPADFEAVAEAEHRGIFKGPAAKNETVRYWEASQPDKYKAYQAARSRIAKALGYSDVSSADKFVNEWHKVRSKAGGVSNLQDTGWGKVRDAADLGAAIDYVESFLKSQTEAATPPVNGTSAWDLFIKGASQ